MSDDLSSLKAALPSPPPPAAARPPPVPPLELTVLSWNIHGSTSAGMPDCRNLLVPRVIAHVNPDVIMLQEIPSQKLLNAVIDYCKQFGRPYSWIATDRRPADRKTEAMVLYNSKLFEPCTREGIPTERAESVDISAFAQEVFPNEGTRELRAGQVDFRVRKIKLFSDRAVAVRLRHRTTKNVLIFISFHNIYTQGEKYGTTREEMASAFCKIVHRMSENEKTLVIGGADFNCTRSTFCRGIIAHIPDYTKTERRASKIDYFVLDKPGNITMEGEEGEEGEEEGDPRPIALDIFPPANDQEHPFRQVYRGLEGDVADYERRVALYKSSLDHDPLVYNRLRVTYH